LKPRSWLILVLAIGTISIVVGILLGMHEVIIEQFNIDPTLLERFEEFIRTYVAGMPVPLP